MKIKIRRLLFWSFFVFFIAASGYLLMIAQGLTIDFESFRLVKTGGFFLRFSPAEAEIFINGEKPEQVDKGFLQNGLIIKNLLPDFYRVRIFRPGFDAWEKTLEVRPGLITAATQIQLWPEKIPSETIVDKNVKDFWFSKNGLIYQNSDDEIIFKDIVLKGETVVLASPASNILATTEGNNLFLIDLENPKTAINLNQLFNSLKQRDLLLPGNVLIKNVLNHPFSSQKILLTTPTSLYSLDLKKLQLERFVTLEKIDAVGLSASEAFLVNGDKLTIVNLLLKRTVESRLEIATTLEKILVNQAGGKVFLQEKDGRLSLYDRNQGNISFLQEKVNDFYISPEEKRLLMVKDDSLEMLYLNNYQSDVKYLTGLKAEIPLARDFKNQIKSLTWAPKTLNYIFVLSQDNFWVTELDIRDKVQTSSLFNGVKKFILNGNDLHILKASGELLRAELNL